MKTKLQYKEKGFTIIEVLIVLAIAGLIMLIVFIAVPSLQRNSRNTQYRSEAGALATSYGEISNNRNGAVLAAGNSTTAGDAQNVFNAARTRNITRLDIQAHSATAPAPTLTNAIIRTGARCAAPDSLTATAGSTRQIAVYYLVETSGGSQPQCQEA